MQKVLKLLFRLDVEKTRFFIREGFDVKDFLLFLTAFASVSGIILLTLWVVNVVQIRIGLYSCGSAEARKAIWALCSIVAIALVIYVVSIIVGIIASIRGHADSHPIQISRVSHLTKETTKAPTSLLQFKVLQFKLRHRMLWFKHFIFYISYL